MTSDWSILPRFSSRSKTFFYRPVDKPLFSPEEAEVERRGPSGFSSVNPPGDHYTSSTYRNSIGRACLKVHPYPDKIKCPVYKLPPEEKPDQQRLQKEHREHCRWHPHQLRHNYATMIRKQFGIEEASNMLDHSSVSMTEVYAERNRDQAIEIAQRVG